MNSPRISTLPAERLLCRTDLALGHGSYEGICDVVEVRGPLTAGQREQIERIRASAQHQLQLIEELLTYTRLQAGRDQCRRGRVDVREEDALDAPREHPDLREVPDEHRGLEHPVAHHRLAVGPGDRVGHLHDLTGRVLGVAEPRDVQVGGAEPRDGAGAGVRRPPAGQHVREDHRLLPGGRHEPRGPAVVLGAVPQRGDPVVGHRREPRVHDDAATHEQPGPAGEGGGRRRQVWGIDVPGDEAQGEEVAAAVGLDLSLRAFPATSVLRDAAQVRLLNRVRAECHPTLAWTLEATVARLEGGRRGVVAVAEVLAFVMRQRASTGRAWRIE